MELQGLNDLLVFKFDKDGKLVTDESKGGLTTNIGKDGVFKIDLESSKGATQANITGLSRTAQAVYGSNAKAEQHFGAYQITGTFGANDIPHNFYDAIVGLEKDSKLGFGNMAKDSTPLAYGGVIAHSYNSNVGVDLYFALPYGNLTPGGYLTMGTDTENPTLVHDTFTLNAAARPSDGLVYEKFYSDEDGFNFDKMLDWIISGTVAGSGTEDPTHKSADQGGTGDLKKDQTTSTGTH
ncbi:phage tail protein [Lactobacillus crispatus]|uniref:phage tail protein n=1 Tax=Lactobacillus crispatus TaxID=47770 RepID=UPI0018DBDB2D|nr:phage tail protein [Lactobacillus crispatus]DAR79669.1 MAG TPA: major tail protein [Caudoviricetes sp.]MBH9538927.1 phage tail protein [Lactobacillus crispatus]MBI1701896.1 tail protein [Lactobacillus crispatus]MCT7888599.1 phage tail protein [Lactobacillus crispatus]MCZ3559213.1 phage tail protein [Lactobacillus crispatus]